MLLFLDGIVGSFNQGFDDIFSLILQVASLAGLLVLLFALVQGVALKNWQTKQFIAGIVILVLVGPGPGWRLLAGEVPTTFGFFKS